MLNSNLQRYQLDHPEVPYHEVIDIIRGQADQEYLDTITEMCMTITKE